MKKYLLILPLLLSGCLDDYSDGDRTGVITKLSRKGIKCKTWEGEMNLGGIRRRTDDDGNASYVANTWQFTIEVPDETLVSQIKAKMDSGEPATLHYVQDPVHWPCRGGTSYFVKSVK